MEKQKPYVVPPGSIFAIAKNYEHGAKSAVTVQLSEDISQGSNSNSGNSSIAERRKAMRAALQSSER